MPLFCTVRQRTHDHDISQPWVVSTAKRNTSMGYYDLCMSRSICDWQGSDFVLPHPQLHEFKVPPTGPPLRAVLASDGLWDVCTYEQAARIVSSCRSAMDAAQGLVAHALKEYIEVQGRTQAGDDTTVLVVELSPQGASAGRAQAVGLGSLFGCAPCGRFPLLRRRTTTKAEPTKLFDSL